MKLTVKEAAALLGKPPRTVRHLAQRGKLPAERVGGRWVFDRDALVQADPDQAAARAGEVQRLADHVQAAVQAVTPPGPTRRRDFYSVRDVGAFKVASAVLAQVQAADDPLLAGAADALRDTLHRLADGFHQYQPELKVARLIDARAACCAAIAELLHAATHRDRPAALPWADELEREALGSLRGLLRRAERRG